MLLLTVQTVEKLFLWHSSFIKEQFVDDLMLELYSSELLYILGGMMSLVVKSKTEDSVNCEVVDGGELKSRRHLNVRGKSATLPSITG